MKPTLSILISSIPSRFDLMMSLYNRLLEEVGDEPVEILCFMDNKKRSIGYKRDALKTIAKGTYLSYIDDDEDFFSGYVSSILEATALNPDVITFKQQCTIENKSFIVDFDLNNPENEEAKLDKNKKYINIKRKPFHVCAWKSTIAKSEDFADVGYGEDWDWCQRLLNKTKTQCKINKVLHHYIYRESVSEAPTESNVVWRNPNDEK